jgi:hypothetical protein
MPAFAGLQMPACNYLSACTGAKIPAHDFVAGPGFGYLPLPVWLYAHFCLHLFVSPMPPPATASTPATTLPCGCLPDTALWTACTYQRLLAFMSPLPPAWMHAPVCLPAPLCPRLTVCLRGTLSTRPRLSAFQALALPANGPGCIPPLALGLVVFCVPWPARLHCLPTPAWLPFCAWTNVCIWERAPEFSWLRAPSWLPTSLICVSMIASANICWGIPEPGLTFVWDCVPSWMSMDLSTSAYQRFALPSDACLFTCACLFAASGFLPALSCMHMSTYLPTCILLPVCQKLWFLASLWLHLPCACLHLIFSACQNPNFCLRLPAFSCTFLGLHRPACFPAAPALDSLVLPAEPAYLTQAAWP